MANFPVTPATTRLVDGWLAIIDANAIPGCPFSQRLLDLRRKLVATLPEGNDHIRRFLGEYDEAINSAIKDAAIGRRLTP